MAVKCFLIDETMAVDGVDGSGRYGDYMRNDQFDDIYAYQRVGRRKGLYGRGYDFKLKVDISSFMEILVPNKCEFCVTSSSSENP